MSVFQTCNKGQDPTRSPAEAQKGLKHSEFCTTTHNSQARRGALANYNAKRNAVLEDALMVGLIRFPAS